MVKVKKQGCKALLFCFVRNQNKQNQSLSPPPIKQKDQKQKNSLFPPSTQKEITNKTDLLPHPKHPTTDHITWFNKKPNHKKLLSQTFNPHKTNE
jgi:hypothetical protein